LWVEPLGKLHDRAAFDEWFRRRAGQDETRNVALRPQRFLLTPTRATALEGA